MRDTIFNPNSTLKPFIPPTEFNRTRGLIQGSVHDPTSYLFGGVAGHAGIFSTIADLTRYMRIWLNGGQIPG
jgi:CubicO group peptidase (beta-lactamase class C family)